MLASMKKKNFRFTLMLLSNILMLRAKIKSNL
jgi:hypothetical protein